MIKMADKNKKGGVNLNEFLLLMKELGLLGKKNDEEPVTVDKQTKQK